MPNTISSSPNIAVLDSQLFADLCSGNFIANLSPSTWIAGGSANVLGAKVQILNPFNVIIRAFPSAYDITPASDGGILADISIPVPTQAGNYQYGKYIISVQVTDADGTNYTVTKTVSICAPNTLDKTKKYGSINAKLSGVCIDGKVYVLVSEAPTYKGVIAESTDQAYTVDYPTGSGLSPINSSYNSFSIPLFEGVYKIDGTVCATYNFGDNVFVKVKYIISYSKTIICSLDESCVFTGLQALNDRLSSDCSDAEKKDTKLRIEKAVLLIDTIDFGVRAGEDVSDYIKSLEDVLGMTCSCNFDNGTPIINNNPAADISITGCNVTSETVGLTKIYTLNLYSYSVSVAENGGALSISDVAINGCIKSQTITFDISRVYEQLKGLVTPADSNAALVESQFWAGVVKGSLNGLDTSCLNLTSDQLKVLGLDGLIQAIINKACQGGSCGATVDSVTSTQSGADVIISWTQTGAFALDVYVDNLLLATVLGSASSYTLRGYSDGNNHSFKVVAKCSNGITGSSLAGSFGFQGCATINAPTVTNANVTNATCPFDLTGLVAPLPSGIEAEWHTANNTLPTSLVPNEHSVTDGVYYVFATDGHGCWSLGTRVTVVCAISSSCSAPQNLTASPVIGGVKISFQAAAFPPPGNSYTVKRKLATDADVDGSYITLGAPIFNGSTLKWEITDATAAANTLYTYKAISNCDVPQSTLLNFANINCPSLQLTSDGSTISYSFNDTGGQITGYDVELYDVGGNLLDTKSHTSPLTNPLTGTFTGLDAGFLYKVRLVPKISTSSFPCSYVSKYTLLPLSVTVGRTGAFSGTLSSSVFGGVPPYTYAWSYTASGGLCEAATINTPSAATSNYTATAYSGVSYLFTLLVTDSIGATATASTTPTGACLVPETPIMMADFSEKALADIEVGDQLLDRDLALGTDIITIVTSKTVHKVHRLFNINNGLLKTSEGHINIIAIDGSKGDLFDLKQSMQLAKEELLPTRSGGVVVVNNIEISDGDFEVINISTTSRKYIANGIVTHNKLACP